MCLIDFHSGLLSKGPQERADGDRDHHLRGKEEGGGGGNPHHRETQGKEGNTMGWGKGGGRPGSAAPFIFIFVAA